MHKNSFETSSLNAKNSSKRMIFQIGRTEIIVNSDKKMSF